LLQFVYLFQQTVYPYWKMGRILTIDEGEISVWINKMWTEIWSKIFTL